MDISLERASLSMLPLSVAQATVGDRTGAGECWWNGRHPFYYIYSTRDDRFLAVAALERGSQAYLLELLGLKDAQPLMDDLEKNGDELRRKLAEVFSTQDLKHWTKNLANKDVCVSPVLSMEEVLCQF